MSTDRPATTDPAEVAPVHTGGNAEDCPACDGRSDLPYPWICPGKDLTASGREPAVRASEPNRKCPLGLRHVNCSCAEPEQPWDEAGCSRSCRNGHTRRWGACAYGKEPAPTLHRFETGVAADGYVSGGHEPMTAEQVAEWLRGQGYTVAPRASEAPGDAHSPTPDVGAAPDPAGAAEAESEPHVHYEVEMYNDGWSIPIYRTDSVDDARAHEEPAVTSASTRIVRVTREVIQ